MRHEVSSHVFQASLLSDNAPGFWKVSWIYNSLSTLFRSQQAWMRIFFAKSHPVLKNGTGLLKNLGTVKSCPVLYIKSWYQAWARLPFKRKWMGRNGMGQDRMRLNGNGIGFENTIDYRSLMVNEIHQYCSQQTWMIFTVQDCSTVLSLLYHKFH